MDALPDAARIVIVGGGVGGASVAHHLAELGERDVVLLDRAELTSGSTFHSAGLVGQLRADPTLTRMNMYSVQLYRSLEAAGRPVGWTESGGIKLASSPERLAEIRRQISWARSFGLPLHEIDVREVAERFPPASLDGVVGACFLESDGHLDPSSLCYALAASARAAGVRIHQRTRVTGIDVRDGVVRGVRTDRGDIRCEVVVDCGGMFAAEIGRLAGVRIPLVPMAHQYVVTEPFRSPGDPMLPTLRDPDLLVYFRQEVDGLVMGGYERDPAPWTATPASYDAVPADFNGRLLAEDWPRFEQIATNAAQRVPVLTDLGVRKLINGPEAFTPDNEFCLGETAVGGFFVAAGFCAHGIAGAGGIGKVVAEWIVDGEPSMDVSHMDIARFGPAYRSPKHTLARTVENYRTYYDIPYPDRQRTAGRPLRRSPAYAWHAAHGAVFAEKAGWERVEWYELNAAGVDAPRPSGWAGRYWSSAIAAEVRATRAAVGLFDETSFAKISITGAGAADFVQWVCDNDVARDVGSVTYTQLLNRRGGIVADCTITRLASDAFLMVTGTASGSSDLAWLRRHARVRRADVRVEDVTGGSCCFALWGPRAAGVLAPLTADPLDLAPRTARELTVGDVPVRAQRVSYVGEDGFELYASSEYAATLWETLVDAGRPVGLTVGGYRAIESMRLEKGYRAFGTELTGETTPDEAGLGFCVRIGKPGDSDFLGRDALLAARADGLRRRLRCLVLRDPAAVVLGSEPVRLDGAVVGRVTSGGYGYSVDASIAYAYLPVEVPPGTSVQLDLFGTWVDAEVIAGPVLR